ncbi:metal-dependent hydrolase family protein [Mucilaginibacter sp. FT3.2]|uniref:metal-dependent hydrolase family protein n=1 Tax=Mucilaginibacter sp. FT3.2 TaxID=2723090 RepID=UPI00160AC919|nr:amidohydrolase family protein [Mucilaginibacter sp. FT3.2]MBB6231358.1 imidazolonepropionase-like amidohydrolase [Mucilaginibacter sp. FT3.2]
MKKTIATIILLIFCLPIFAQSNTSETYILLKPDRIFDGERMHAAWWVLIKGNHIEAVGEATTIKVPANAKVIDLKGATLMPGLIEGHSHLFLHPYNETSWNEQVLTESRAERTARAVNHARATLMAGFTTVRDLGTEGAAYDDVGLKTAINKGIIAGPRMLVATRAIVATGSYGPKSEVAEAEIIKGGEEADGIDGITKVVRSQIGHGADVVKIYVDYHWGLNSTAAPTFTEEELKVAVQVAKSSGRMVAVHSSTTEGMRRAIAAGVTTIEHGNGGTPELFKLMKEKGIALCPTLNATESILSYSGWKKGTDPEPAAVKQKHYIFTEALKAGVAICMGGDVGVFAHGDNAQEMILMAEYGMKPLDVLRSATSVNAAVFALKELGNIKAGYLADLVAVEGNPVEDMKVLKKMRLVVKDGVVVKE